MIFKNRNFRLDAHSRQHSIKSFPNEKKPEWGPKQFLTIAPALPLVAAAIGKHMPKCVQRSTSTLSADDFGERLASEITEMSTRETASLQIASTGKAELVKSRRDKDIDRICLDRRGLTQLPNFISEKNIRMLSLQHNLINRMDGFANLSVSKLVFLDLYNNQIETIAGLECLESLRVLLVGKNRLKKIGGIKTLTNLEVLDLHGNQINQISAMGTLCELKVLNLAGNQIRAIDHCDLKGLLSLQELNLKRNRLRKINNIAELPRLEKLLLSNNEMTSVNDMSGICKMTSLKEVTIDGNPISMSNDCVHLLVSYLPNLKVLSHMQVSESVRRSALLWRRNKENLAKTIANERKEAAKENILDAVSNGKANWELLRKQTKYLPQSFTSSSLKDLRNIEEAEASVDKTIQSDSVLSVASSITLSSRDSLTASKRVRKSIAGLKHSLSEDSPGTAETSEDIEYFKLPPILASLGSESKAKEACVLSCDASSQSNAKSEDNNAERAKDVAFSETSDGTAESEESEGEDSANTREENNNIAVKRLKSANQPRKCSSKKEEKERCLTAAAKCKFQAAAPGKVREQGGDYLIEICGRSLNIYGQGALRFIDRPWNPIKAGDVTTVRFNYINFSGICNVLGKLKQRFPNAENFIFRETNITFLGQLNALADVQGLSSLQIDDEGNPITSKSWRNYAIYRLAHWGLKKINGKEVTDKDLADVAREYQGLSDLVLWSLPECLLQPLLNRLRIDGNRSQQSAKQWLKNADPALRNVVCKEALQWKKGTQDDLFWRQKEKAHLGNMIDLTCKAVDKLRIFEERWPTIFNHLIRDVLVDYSHMDSYMKKCLQELT